MLEHLVADKLTDNLRMFPVARAIAYLLTVTAQPRRTNQREMDLSQ
jgi:hypothetical protein